MLLKSLTEKIKEDPAKAYLYLDRYVNFGSKTYSSFADQTDADYSYRPTNPKDTFEVPCVLIPKDKVFVYLDHPTKQLLSFYIKEAGVIFPIHPEVFHDDRTAFIEEIRQYPQVKPLLVSPGASTRTVMYRQDLPHFIKLHYPKRISRFVRRLRKNTIKTCLSVSRDLRNLPGLAYLPETIGVAYGTNQGAWGFIIRETAPRPFQKKGTFLIPLFALYSQDINALNDPPLLIQLIQHFNEDPIDFVLDHIFKPLIRCWCLALIEKGILLEAHGQNTLLELNAELYPSRIVYRDLDVYVDREIRNEKGLHLDFPQSHVVDPEKRRAIYSLKYDSFIGHHLFDYLASLMNKYYGVDPVLIQDVCKEYFHRCFPDSRTYFSDKVFYYEDEVHSENKYKLIETDEKPKWRS